MSMVDICIPAPYSLLSRAEKENLSGDELAALHKISSDAGNAHEQIIAGLDLIADYLYFAQDNEPKDRHLNTASWLISEFTKMIERIDHLQYIADKCETLCAARSLAAAKNASKTKRGARHD